MNDIYAVETRVKTKSVKTIRIAYQTVRTSGACRLCSHHVDHRRDAVAIWVAPASPRSKRQARYVVHEGCLRVRAEARQFDERLRAQAKAR